MYRSYVLFNSTIHDDVDQTIDHQTSYKLNIFKMSLDDTTSQVNVVHHISPLIIYLINKTFDSIFLSRISPANWLCQCNILLDTQVCGRSCLYLICWRRDWTMTKNHNRWLTMKSHKNQRILTLLVSHGWWCEILQHWRVRVC